MQWTSKNHQVKVLRMANAGRVERADHAMEICVLCTLLLVNVLAVPVVLMPGISYFFHCPVAPAIPLSMIVLHAAFMLFTFYKVGATRSGGHLCRSRCTRSAARSAPSSSRSCTWPVTVR